MHPVKYTRLILLLRLCFAGLVFLCPASAETGENPDEIIDVETDAEGVIAFTSVRDGNITRLTISAGWDSTPAWK